MLNDYKFTWYNSERSWKGFFSELKFAIKYKLADDQKKKKLYWEIDDPLRDIKTSGNNKKNNQLIPDQAPRNSRSTSCNSIIKF